MQNQNIAFIGGGNMASSLIGGLVADGYDPQQLWVSEPDDEKRTALAARFGLRPAQNNPDAVEQAGVMVLAVKPQLLKPIARELAPQVQRLRPLVISIAAGVRESDLQRWLGGGVSLVRCMPNTPAMIQAGATALHASRETSADQRSLAESILRAVGVTLWVDNESMLDAVTALSGSGPAYFFYVMEAMEQAGEQLGLTARTAHLLTLQTALGAARMAIESSDSPETLRHKVTSPGGTTERALETLRDGELPQLLARALRAARDRSRELSALLGEE